MSRYKVDANSLEGFLNEIEKGKKELNIRLQDSEDFSWNVYRAEVSKLPIEGGEKLVVISRYGLTEGEVYVRILEHIER
jgi:hypothetical protein